MRGWEGGSVLGTIGLGPRPHALGFAKKCECRLRKALVFAIKNTILRQGETPMDPPKKLKILVFYMEARTSENHCPSRAFFFGSATATMALDPEAHGASGMGLQNGTEWHEPWAPSLAMARPGIGLA